MAQYIEELYNNLFKIREYLIKIGPKRRKREILNKKLNEAKEVLVQYNTYIDKLNLVLSFKDETEKTFILACCSRFKNLYQEVTALCTPETNEETEQQRGEENDRVSDNYSESDMSNEMAKFDLKVALSLLPLMNDREDTTKELIDGIEYYSSTIDATTQSQLITFILKTRLSQSAKLKLSCKYDTVASLLQDMRKQLLPQKAATAIQTKLQTTRQNERSVADYGKEISELFVDLTISQADGNPDHYEILRPLNEKMAIKRFADGLRNSRLSTIIAARNFSTLKDAIQAAQEEDTASTSTAQVTSMSRGKFPRGNGNFRRAATPYRGQRSQTYRGQWNRYQQSRPQAQFPRNSRGTSVDRSARGRSSRSRYRGSCGSMRSQRHVYAVDSQAQHDSPHQHRDESVQPNFESLNHFFRD